MYHHANQNIRIMTKMKRVFSRISAYIIVPESVITTDDGEFITDEIDISGDFDFDSMYKNGQLEFDEEGYIPEGYAEDAEDA